VCDRETEEREDDEGAEQGDRDAPAAVTGAQDPRAAL
jgi:hypothetical protein